MGKIVDPQSLVVVIQAISTHWEKSARGGPYAVLRSHVPKAVKLPDFSATNVPLSYVLHSVHFASRNDFAEPTKSSITVSETELTGLDGVSIDFANGTLSVFYQYDTSQGAPERYARKIEALKLTKGLWGRVEYNGRHSGAEGYWWYEKWVYNIGLFSHPSVSAFTESEPTKIFSQMAHLL